MSPVVRDPQNSEEVKRRAARQPSQAATPDIAVGQAMPAGRGGHLSADAVLHLQGTVGNQAVLRRLAKQHAATPPLQRADDDDQVQPGSSQQPASNAQADTGAQQPSNNQPAGDQSNAGDGQAASTDQSGSGQLLVQAEGNTLPQGTAEVDGDLKIKTVDSGDSGQPQEESPAAAAPTAQFVNAGRQGTVPVRFVPDAPDDGRPHAFTNGGQTGTIAWAGGGGAGPHGNESTGSVQSQVEPVYESRSNGVLKDSDAWIRAGTGNAVNVTRSYLGANAGDQGNGHYVTAGAAGRFNAHEVLHVNSTKGIYDANIPPMITRAASYTFNSAGGYSMGNAYTQLGAISSVKSVVRWKDSIQTFSDADTTANRPMGPTDTNDLATGTYPVDAGPGNVAGKAYQHRVRLPSEPNPA